MRWLFIALLISVAALLFAAAGTALHIWIQRARIRSNPQAGAPPASGKAEETDVETEL
jgi:hypothetical protein